MITNSSRRFAAGLGLLAFVAVLAFAAEKKAAPSELSKAEHFLKKFEDKVKRLRGQPFDLGYEEEEALTRIKALKEAYPDDPAVDKMMDRARAALMSSKGQAVEITPAMFAYRENQKKLVQAFAAEAEKQWAWALASYRDSPQFLAKPFPPPPPRENSLVSMRDRLVILEEFEYPANEFSDMGRQFVFVGAGARGYYYVDLSGRAWLGAYEAVKRYRRFVNPAMPEAGKWTIAGRVVGMEMLVPQAGKKKTIPAFWGWIVEPEAILVPGQTLGRAIPHRETGGEFAGEERLEELKGAMYSVTKVPDDVTPERLVEIYVAAIKEKNYGLFLDCIDPGRRTTPIARDLCLYHWEWHQHRFANFYVHVLVNPAKIKVRKGFDEGDSLENFFLSEEAKAKVKAISEPLVELAELTTQAFDERGRQYGSPKPRFLKRVEKKRWYITNFEQPF